MMLFVYNVGDKMELLRGCGIDVILNYHGIDMVCIGNKTELRVDVEMMSY